MEQIYDHILVRYGELTTKGKNRKDFTRKLLNNTKNTLVGFELLTYQETYDRLYIHLNGTNFDDVKESLANVFGISSFSPTIKVSSDIESIVANAFDLAMNQSNKVTFKVEARRHDKQFFMSSDEINRAVATKILQNSELTVDVHKPDLRVKVEVRQEFTYIMADVYKGAGGYPVSSGGKGLLLLSGGIDSPVAGYLAQKRGIEIDCVHFSSPPYTSDSAMQKVLDLAQIISKYQGKIRVHVVPFTKLQLAIYDNCDESYAITIMRRMMLRISEQLAEKHKCLALVTGESVGQVASQTLHSMAAINEVTNIPILRPVVCYDKLEIIDVSIKIDTYATSILPFEDCCTIFTPKKPVTRPSLKKCLYHEAKFDFETLIAECLEETRTTVVRPAIKEDNLF